MKRIAIYMVGITAISLQAGMEPFERTGTGHAATMEKLEKTYNFTFGKKANLILQPITDEQSKKWNEFLKSANKYITKYNPNIKNNMESLASISTDIISELQKLWKNTIQKSFKSEQLKKSGATSLAQFRGQIDAENMDQFAINNVSMRFDVLANKLTKTSDELQLAMGEWGDKRPAKLLNTMATLLEATIQKAQDDASTLTAELAHSRVQAQLPEELSVQQN